jgi:acetyl-CoA carboxylase biotin carboxylase subunit
VAAAKGASADAVHPGYGFLSENAEFAQAVVDAGLIFVGPSPRAITLMGDKAQARACAMKAGVPTVPGSEGVVENLAAALVNADQIGYPVMLKAAAGGGGRGIRVAADAKQLEAQYAIATREAQSAFGYGGLERMKRALGEFDVEGLETTKPLHLGLLDDEGFRAGDYHTGYLEANLSRIVSGITD